MKLDATNLRYLPKEDFRLLSTVEMGSRNHEIVPINLIARMTKLRPQTITRQLQALAKNKLVSFESDSKYDGVRLTYGGYDFLALKAFSSRGSVLSIGQQIGVGKESDIYLVHGTAHHEYIFEADSEQDSDAEAAEGTAQSVQIESPPEFHERVLKIQRLGRTSFRTVKTNRDYHQHRNSCSWLYLSRLAAGLEYRFMRALREAGLPVPKPLDWNRHCVVMEWIRGTLLDNVRLEEAEESIAESDSEVDEDLQAVEGKLKTAKIFFIYFLDEISKFEIENRVVEWINEEHVPGLYARLMQLIGELAELGLIHGDFNEFNLMLTRDENNLPVPVIIDFPQMVSVDHSEGRFYFERDVECLRVFFAKRFGFKNEDGAIAEPVWEEIMEKRALGDKKRLDVELRASGYIKPRRKRTAIIESTGNEDTEFESEHNSDEDDLESDEDSFEEESYDVEEEEYPSSQEEK